MLGTELGKFADHTAPYGILITQERISSDQSITDYTKQLKILKKKIRKIRKFKLYFVITAIK